MKKYTHWLLVSILLVLLPLHGFADQVEDTLVARVRLKANLKLDSQARKEITAAAAKIKKSKGGTVKLRGVYPSATSVDEYLSKSVFMAREVEQYLKTLLPPRQQIYTVTSKFSPGERGAQNVVEILLYPFELKPAESDEIRIKSLESQGIGKAAVVPAVVAPVKSEPEASSTKPADAGKISSERTVPAVATEDAKRAEELVNRAKRRAAERAKRKADTD